MIQWMDFVLDDFIGPSLKMDQTSCRDERFGRPIVMEDEKSGGNTVGHVAVSTIQETGQVTRPARMVGDHSLDLNARTSKEAGRSVRTLEVRQKGAG